MELWNLAEGGAKQASVQLSEVSFDVAFSPDGQIVATGGPSVTLWAPDDGSKLDILQGTASGLVVSVEFSPDGRVLAAARICVDESRDSPSYFDNMMEFWDMNTRKPLAVSRMQEATKQTGASPPADADGGMKD